MSGCVPEGLRDVATNDLSWLGLPFCGAAVTPAAVETDEVTLTPTPAVTTERRGDTDTHTRSDHATNAAREFLRLRQRRGVTHQCGVKRDGSVACWGSDGSGQSTPPTGSFVSVSAGSEYTCGVRSDGSGRSCWGWDEYGQSTPPAGSFNSVSAGSEHTCKA